MKTDLLRGRTFYRSSGGVNWGRFLPWVCLLFVGSGVGAVILFLLFRAGWYLIGIVPALAALGVAGLARLGVANGQCRNWWLAGVSGLLAGVLLYFGYFYVGMISTLGPKAATELRLLPRYIRFRMATDVTRDVHDSRKDEDRLSYRSGGSLGNWLFFSLETVVVLTFTTLGGYRRSRKPYCETCGRWMARELTYFEPSKDRELMAALEAGSARSLAALLAAPAFATFPNSTLALEYCPTLKEGASRDCPVFVSLKSVTANPTGATFDAFEQSKGKVLARNVQLSADELPALALRFPFFESYTGRTAVTALMPKPEPSQPEESGGGAIAEIKPVEGDYAGKVLTRKTKLICNSFVLAGLAGIFAGIGLMAWGGTMAFPTSVAPTPSGRVFGVLLLAVGGVVFLSVAALFLINPSYFGNRYLRKVLKREFARRPKCLVDINDPEALFVEIVPKMNWGKLALDNAGDVGLLRVDRSRREILVEGDKDRCRIPAAAITYCEVEQFVEGQGTHAATKVYYVVLRAAHPTQFWEAPIRERSGTGMFRSRSRKKAAQRLWEAIRAMQGHGERQLVKA